MAADSTQGTGQTPDPATAAGAQRAWSLEEIRTAIRSLTSDDRRKIGLFILELEKDHFQSTVAPQLAEDLEKLSKAVQDTVESIKRRIK